MEKKTLKNIVQELTAADENLTYKPNGLLSVIHIFFDYALMVMAAYVSLISDQIIVYLLAITVIGSRMRGLENLLHEASHHNLFVNKGLNRWVGRYFCAFPIGNSLDAYKASHFEHHRYFGDPERDPDLKHYKALGIDQFPCSKKALKQFFLNFFSPLTLLHYFGSSINKFIYNKQVSRKENILRVSFVLLMLSFIHVFSLWTHFLYFWVIPYITTFQWIKGFAELTEHGGLYHKPLLEKTRNNLYRPWISFLLYPHNDHYHLLHHLFPFCSYHHAKSLHQKLLRCSPTYHSLNHCKALLLNKQHPSMISQLLTQSDISHAK